MIRVTVKHQGVMKPAILKRMVGDRWWRNNCHGALTLKSVEGITNVDVRQGFSTFRYKGKPVTLLHEGIHAWLNDVSSKADAGKTIKAATYQLDETLFVARKVQRPRPVGSHCDLKVTRQDDGRTVACTRAAKHRGECTPQKKRQPIAFQR